MGCCSHRSREWGERKRVDDRIDSRSIKANKKNSEKQSVSSTNIDLSNGNRANPELGNNVNNVISQTSEFVSQSKQIQTKESEVKNEILGRANSLDVQDNVTTPKANADYPINESISKYLNTAPNDAMSNSLKNNEIFGEDDLRIREKGAKIVYILEQNHNGEIVDNLTGKANDAIPSHQKPEINESEYSSISKEKNSDDFYQTSIQLLSSTEPNTDTDTTFPKDLASKLAGTNLIDSNKYGSCEFEWTDNKFQVSPGLNIIAVCKNADCQFYLDDVICPKGLYRERNGFCSFDREIHKVNCPICKKRIKADNSFGFVFFQCKFEISFMLDDGICSKIEKVALNNKILFAKCSNYLSGHLQYLDLQFFD